jgi:hypothetical protein
MLNEQFNYLGGHNFMKKYRKEGGRLKNILMILSTTLVITYAIYYSIKNLYFCPCSTFRCSI